MHAGLDFRFGLINFLIELNERLRSWRKIKGCAAKDAAKKSIAPR